MRFDSDEELTEELAIEIETKLSILREPIMVLFFEEEFILWGVGLNMVVAILNCCSEFFGQEKRTVKKTDG